MSPSSFSSSLYSILYLLLLLLFLNVCTIYCAVDGSGGNCVGNTLPVLPAGYDKAFCVVSFNHDLYTGNTIPSNTAISRGFRRAYAYWHKRAHPETGVKGVRVANNTIYVHIDYVDIGLLSNAQQKAAAKSVALGNYPAANITFLPDLILTPPSSAATDNIAQGVWSAGAPHRELVMIGCGSSGDSVFQCLPDATNTTKLDQFCADNNLPLGARRFKRLFTARTPASKQFADVLSLLKLRGVKKLAIVYEREPYSFSALVGARQTSKDLKFDVVEVDGGATQATNTLEKGQVLARTIIDAKVDAVFLPINQFPTCLNTVLGMRSLGYEPPHVAMGTCGTLGNNKQLGDHAYMVIASYFDAGLVGNDYVDKDYFPPDTTTGTTSSAVFAKLFAAEYPNDYITSVPGYSEGAAFAAMYAVNLALNSLTLMSEAYDPKSLGDAIQNLYTTSYYGQISFNQFGMLFQSAAVTSQYDAQLVPKLLTPLSSAQISLIYPRPTNVLLPVQKIQWNYNGALAVLSYIFAVLGSWTSLIILEQAIYERRANLSKTKLHLMTLAAAGSFACCGVWASQVIAVNGFNLVNDYVDVTNKGIDLFYKFQGATSILALLPITLLTYIGYLAVLMSFKTIQMKQTLIAGQLLSNTGTGSTDATTATGAGSKKHHSKSSEEEAHSAVANAAANGNEERGEEKPGKKKKSKDTDSVYGVIRETFAHFSFWHVIGIICISGAIAIGEGMIHSALVLPGPVTLSGSYYGPAIAIFIVVGGFLSLQMFFHLVKLRLLGAFVMGGAILAVNLLVVHGISVTYDPTFNFPDGLLTPATLTIIAAVVGAVIVFILLGIQFTAMKLSRNTLDLIVKKVQKELEKEKKKTAVQTAQINQSQINNANLKSCIDLINYIRPTLCNAATSNLLAYSPLCAPLIVKAFGEETAKKLLKAAGGGGIREEKKEDLNEIELEEINNSDEEQEQGDGGAETGGKSKTKASKKEGGGGVATAAAEGQSNAAYVAAMGSKERLEYFKSILKLLEANTAGSSNTAVNIALTLMSGKYAITLQDIFNHPVCLELFKDCVGKEMASENIAFLLVLKQYQNEINNKNLRRVLGDELLKDFISPKGKFSINISSRTRTTILQLAKTGGAQGNFFTSNFFDPAVNEIMELTGNDTFNRFQETSQFLLAILLCASAKHQGINFGSAMNDLSGVTAAMQTQKKQNRASKIAKLPNRIIPTKKVAPTMSSDDDTSTGPASPSAATTDTASEPIKRDSVSTAQLTIHSDVPTGTTGNKLESTTEE